jgi:Ca2+-transporting ATPase
MSIGVEQHEKDILIRPPKNTNAPVMSKENVLAILVQSLIITSVAFVVYMLALKLNIAGAETLRQQQSLTFSVLVGMHLSQAYFSRTVLGSIFHHGVTENHYLIYATLLSTFFLVLGVELPGLNTWLDLESIRWVGWGVVILCLLIHGVMIETGKYFLRRYLIKSRGGVDGTFVVVAVGNKQSTA